MKINRNSTYRFFWLKFIWFIDILSKKIYEKFSSFFNKRNVKDTKEINKKEEFSSKS